MIQPGIDPGTSRLVAQCLNHYATPGPETKFHTRTKVRVKLHFSLHFKLCVPTYQMDRHILNQMPEKIPRLKSLPDIFSNVILIYRHLPPPSLSLSLSLNYCWNFSELSINLLSVFIYNDNIFAISGFRCDVTEIFAILEFYAE